MTKWNSFSEIKPTKIDKVKYLLAYSVLDIKVATWDGGKFMVDHCAVRNPELWANISTPKNKRKLHE